LEEGRNWKSLSNKTDIRERNSKEKDTREKRTIQKEREQGQDGACATRGAKKNVTRKKKASVNIEEIRGTNPAPGRSSIKKGEGKKSRKD